MCYYLKITNSVIIMKILCRIFYQREFKPSVVFLNKFGALLFISFPFCTFVKL